MKIALTLLTVAGFTAAANAQPLRGVIKWEGSANGGASWAPTISVIPGDAYLVRATVGWADGSTPSVGFAGATFEQINLAGAHATDVFGGASGPGGVPTYVARRQGAPESWRLYTGDGGFGLKIDNVVESNRTNFGQLPKIFPGGIPNPEFFSDNPWTVFQMNCIAGDFARVITISGAWTRLGTPASNEFKVYTTETGTNKKPVEEAMQEGLTVVIDIPAPSTLTLLAVSGLAAARRKR